MKHKYTHRDSAGILWRFVGSRPVSMLADAAMEAIAPKKRKKRKPTKKRK